MGKEVVQLDEKGEPIGLNALKAWRKEREKDLKVMEEIDQKARERGQRGAGK